MADEDGFDYSFKPQEDITVSELALVMELCGLKTSGKALRENPSLRRHFNKPKGWWEEDDN